IASRKLPGPLSAVVVTVMGSGGQSVGAGALTAKNKHPAAMRTEVILVFMSVLFLARATPTLQFTDVVSKMRCDQKVPTKKLRATSSPLHTWQQTHPRQRVL